MNKTRKIIAVILEEVNGYTAEEAEEKSTDEYGSQLWLRIDELVSQDALTGKIRDMRRAQNAYFDARRKKQFTKSRELLKEAKSLEKEVDEMI